MRCFAASKQEELMEHTIEWSTLDFFLYSITKLARKTAMARSRSHSRSLSIGTKCRSHPSISLVSVNLSSRSLCAYWLYVEEMISPVVHCHRFLFSPPPFPPPFPSPSPSSKGKGGGENKARNSSETLCWHHHSFSRTFSCLIIELTSALF